MKRTHRLLAISLLVTSLWAAPVAAGTSTVTAPRIVYSFVGQTVEFAGTDGISLESRLITMSASISGSCNPTAGNGYSIALCGRVELTLNDIYGGTLFLAGTTKMQSNPDVWKTASGAIIEGGNPTDPAISGGSVLTIFMNGTLAQLNGALAGLQYIPASNYEDGTYNEKTPPGTGTPYLNVLVNDGSVSATNALASSVLRVEGLNGGPDWSAPYELWATAGVDNAYPLGAFDPAMFSVIDPELCLREPNNRCGNAYNQAPAPFIPEPNDAMLLVMWLQEPNCGQFELRSTAGFTNLGGPTLPSVNAILTAPNALDLEQDAADAILATLGTAGAVNLSGQASGFTTAFAGTTADIGNVRYALSQLTYRAPPGNVICHLKIAFSDLGNNGMPLAWIAPDPQASPAVPEHEIPNAFADADTVTFQVTDPNIVFADGFE